MYWKSSVCFFFLSLWLGYGQLPDEFINLQKVDSTLQVELRYASSNNFMGRKVKGYTFQKAYGTKGLANALLKVQNKLAQQGLGLKIYDAYRPQRAVDNFVAWAEQTEDTLQKEKYYPKIAKKNLFQEGYIARKSGHSRGSTVDLTLIYIEGPQKNKELDMGGSWDYFGERSHYAYTHISDAQKANRKRLRTLMIASGFKPYEKEWWHFTLANEPFPNTYFDFIPE